MNMYGNILREGMEWGTSPFPIPTDPLPWDEYRNNPELGQKIWCEDYQMWTGRMSCIKVGSKQTKGNNYEIFVKHLNKFK